MYDAPTGRGSRLPSLRALNVALGSRTQIDAMRHTGRRVGPGDCGVTRPVPPGIQQFDYTQAPCGAPDTTTSRVSDSASEQKKGPTSN